MDGEVKTRVGVTKKIFGTAETFLPLFTFNSESVQYCCPPILSIGLTDKIFRVYRIYLAHLVNPEKLVKRN